MFRERGIEIKTPEQIERMRAAGLVVGRTLALLTDAASTRRGSLADHLRRGDTA